MTFLSRLPEGTDFQLCGLPGVTGTLLYANECRARVRIHGTERRKQFETLSGQIVDFVGRPREEDWSPFTQVERLPS